MPLMTIREWREASFTPASRPAVNTIRLWLEKGELPGRKIGGNWYVAEREKALDNPLVKKVLNT
jgi:hypothetical protein